MAHRAGYTLHEQLHSSHRSTLIRAIRLSDQCPVILKLTSSDYLDRRRTLEIRREYAIARRVQGDGIVRVLGLEEFPDRAALVLEDFGGASLRHLLDERGPLDVSTFLDFALRISAALGHIHQHGVIHKDIKPHNIIVNPDTGVLKITDFSLSVGLSLESVTPEIPTHLTGTLAYMAPEQTGRMNRGVDYRADFYALGATFFELLTDRRVFATTAPLELLHAHVAQVPPSPRELNPEVPECLAAIVLKLLAKAPEERYQSTWGLIADLEECQRLLREGGPLSSFPLGLADRPHQFRPPQGLHGRDSDVALLTRTYARSAAGRGQLLLISGSAGIGKSSLVNELYRVTAASRGRVATGKCDQLMRSEPFDAVHQALQHLVRQTLAEGEAETALIRERLQEVLGANLAVLVEAVPDTRALVGEQPSSAPLSSAESRNRLNLVLVRTIQAFATPGRPLALFLDDLQWADSATLTLLQTLARDLSARPLLLVGAYRDAEVSTGSPLTLALEELRASGTTWEQLHLTPLGLKEVARMVCESTTVEARRGMELAHLIHSRTGGNPFAIKAFLLFLHERELLRFDPRSRQWEWDLARIESQELPEDVAALMASESRQLPPETRDLLQRAACLGVTFGFRDLTVAHGAKAGETARALWTAIERRLVLPLGKDYVLLDPQGGAVELSDLDVSFRFVHDRVRQAAYSLIPEAERTGRHLEVGLRLYEDARATKTLDERMFAILPHLGHAPERIGPDSLRLELAGLHLTAGRRAKTSGAYRTAYELFRIGGLLIPPAAREQEHERTFTLQKELNESLYLAGDIEAAASGFSTLLAQARTPAQRASVLCLQATLSTLHDRSSECLELGIEGLRLLGIDIPAPPDDATLAMELQRVAAALEGRETGELLDLPRMSDPRAMLAAELLGAISIAAYFVSQKLLVLLTLWQVRLSLEHGNSRFSPYGYAAYGFVVSTILGDPASGRRFSLLGFELATRFRDSMQQARALYVHAGFIDHWTRSARAGIHQLAEAYKVLLESGDWQHAGHCFTFLSWRRLALGEPLQELLAENQRFLEVPGARQDTTNLQLLQAFRQMLLLLTGGQEEPQQDAQLPHFSAAPKAYITQARVEQQYLFRQLEPALELARENATQMLALPGAFLLTTHAFYYALCAAAVYPGASEDRKQELLAVMEQQRAYLEQCAQRAPENFSPYHLLVCAELARVKGQHAEAHTRYEEAITAARSSGFTSVEAVACEQACRFQLELNRLPLASAYLVEALNAYERWGAAGKVHLLVAEQAHLLHSYSSALRTWDHTLQRAGLSMARPQGGEYPELSSSADLSSTDSFTEVLDVSSVMKASQAISSELHFPQLAANLIDILMESTGAQRGVLVLQREEDFFVEASGEVGSGSAPLLPVQRMAQCDALCQTIAELVLSTGSHLLLDDASAQEPFRGDAYISRHHVRSVLCVPILHRKQLLGLVYLENNLITGAFNANRLRVLGMLLAQAAISLENAGLYRKLEKSHRTLEHRVQERTEELHHKNAELQGALERLKAMQAQIITQEKLASLGSLTAGIAHELKNPLNFVKNFSELSLELVQELSKTVETEEPGPLLEELKQNISKVREHGQRASGIIDGMLRHARNNRGEQQPTSINQLVEEAVRLVQHGQRAMRPPRHVTIDTAFDDSVPRCLLVPEDLRRVILNLLDNACYSAHDKAQREAAGQPRLRVSTRWTGTEVEIRVRDNGHGVPTSVRNKLFTPFFTTKPAGEGTGLGLSLSHEIIVVGLGGRLRVESEEGQYAEFTVVLPGKLTRSQLNA